MMQWWNNATIRAFRERTQCIIDQYSRYKIDEVGLYVNGRMTQGENIADNGGLKQSFRVSSNVTVLIKRALLFNYFKGIPKMGCSTWWRARSSRSQSNPRSIILPELRSNLVWIDASRRRFNQSSIQRTFARTYTSSGTAIQFMGFCKSVWMSIGLANESY